jgi:peptidoglycan hydrolase CwlO-like protein
MNTFFKSILILFAVILISCESTSGEFAAEIEATKRLQHKTDSLQKAFDALDVKRIKSQIPEVQRVMKELAMLEIDTANKKYWIKTLAPIDFVDRSFTKFLKDEEKIRTELAYTQGQVDKLLNSLYDEQLDSAQAKKFLEEEQKATELLRIIFYKRVLMADRALTAWDSTQENYLDLLAKSNSLAQ